MRFSFLEKKSRRTTVAGDYSVLATTYSVAVVAARLG
jgi:hypothetical protein